MHKQLPHYPHPEHLKKQAKQLLKAQRAGNLQACQRFQAALPRLAHAAVEEVREAKISLREAQHVLAREYGFASWKALTDIVTASSRDEAFRTFNGALTETLWSTELHRLIEQAHTAPREASELMTDAGDMIQVERDSVPGMGFRLTMPEHSGWLLMQVEPLSSRPSWYPEGLPFLPHQSAWIAQDGTRRYAVWRKDQLEETEPRDAVRLLTRHPAWGTFSETAQHLVDQMHGGSAEARKQLFDLAQGKAADLHTEMAELAGLVQQQFEDTAPGAEQFEELTRSVVAQSLQEGWTLSEEKGGTMLKYFMLDRQNIRRDIQAVNAKGAKRIQLWDTARA